MKNSKQTPLPWVMAVSLVMHVVACIGLIYILLYGFYMLRSPHGNGNSNIGPQFFAGVLLLLPFAAYQTIMTSAWGLLMLFRKASFLIIYAVHSGIVSVCMFLYGITALTHLSSENLASQLRMLMICFSIIAFLVSTSIYNYKSVKVRRYLSLQ